MWIELSRTAFSGLLIAIRQRHSLVETTSITYCGETVVRRDEYRLELDDSFMLVSEALEDSYTQFRYFLRLPVRDSFPQ